MLTRRTAMTGLLATPAILRATIARADARILKISHHFPGGTISQGDFRDRLVRRFAAAVTEKTKGSLAFEIYPAASLMKTVAQYSALRRGALDISLYPLAYAGGEVPELNITLMPCMTTSYEQGYAWKTNAIGRELMALLDKRGVRMLTWVWQGGGIASRSTAVVNPADVKGLKARGASRDMELMLKSAGAIISAVTSDETYAAMQTGSLDAAVTSSTSLISFRLDEVAKNVTTARQGSFWFMLEPLIMSKSIYDSLTPDQQRAVTEAGLEQESFALEQAQADDSRMVDIYSKAGVGVHDMTPESIARWRVIAQDTAWKDFAGRSQACANLLALAQSVTI